MNGYYKISRKLLTSDFWLLEPFTKPQAWLDLIGLASYKKSKIRVKNGETIDIERGECAWSVLKLAERWRWSRGKVNRFIEQLKNEKMIQQKICSNLTIISILNYNFYQDGTTNDTTNSTTNGTHYKKEKKEKNINLSLINDDERLGKREREILKSFCKKNKVQNVNAYIKTLIKNGDYKEIIEEEERKQALRERKTKSVDLLQEVINPEESEKGFQMFLEQKQKILKRIK